LSEFRRKAKGKIDENPQLEYLGHAGFVYRYRGVCILIDPWFYPAFEGAWFPFPNNRYLVEEILDWQEQLTHIYISHEHEDHFDKQFLQQLNPATLSRVDAVIAKFESGDLEEKLRMIGFQNITALPHRGRLELDSVKLQVFQDVSFKEDSALLVESANGFRFLHLNDCNTQASALPKRVHLLTAQFAGAQWHPACYGYSEEKNAVYAAKYHSGLVIGLKNKIKHTQAKYFLPSAGVHVLLDDTVEGNNILRFNDLETCSTIFPRWENFQKIARAIGNDLVSTPETYVFPQMQPGDRLDLRPESKPTCLQRPNSSRPASASWSIADESTLRKYKQLRWKEIARYHEIPYSEVSTHMVESYIRKLHERNLHLSEHPQKKWRKVFCIMITEPPGTPQGLDLMPHTRREESHTEWVECQSEVDQVTIATRPRKWYVVVGAGGPHVFEDLQTLSENGFSFHDDYTFIMHERLLFAIVQGHASWEHALLSMRVEVRREPDVYDMHFMGFLRYGHQPDVTRGLADLVSEQERKTSEMIEFPELPGKSFQRYCPHQGEDLKNATVINGVIICPRHHWEFCGNSGKCISGGNTDLTMQSLEW
jgi:UDP-MurNAc hydroxylase